MRKIFIILLFFHVFSGYSHNIDIRLLREINLNRNIHMDNTFKGFTNSAGPVAYGVPLLLLFIGFFKRDIVVRKKSFFLGAAVVLSAIIANILKYVVNRPRPFITYSFIEKMSGGGSPSFPSGHTTDAFAIATALSLVFPNRYVIVLSYLWAILVAYSRMDLGVHYPSDVLAGAVIGAGSAYLCYKAQQWINHKRKI